MQKIGSGTPESRYLDLRKKHPGAVGILIEGDSWFAYPGLIGKNIPRQLKEMNGNRTVHLDYSHSGDDAREIMSGRQYDRLFEVMASGKFTFDCILFSGGGNDIVAGNLPLLLNRYQPGFSWEDCFNFERFNRRLRQIEDAYLDLAALRDDYQPAAYIFSHGYDYAVPSGKDVRVLGFPVAGRWIKERMEDRQIPETLHRRILDYMLAEFDNRMIRLEQSVDRWVHVRTQGTLKESDWENELHPTDPGFRKIAAKFQTALRGVFPQLPEPPVV